MWHHLWHLDVSWEEKVLRAIFVYAFLLIALRLFGRRELSQLTAFDLIVLLTLSNILQNAMIGNDNSVTGGLIGATVLLSVNAAIAYAAFRSRRFERLVEGVPQVLIHAGRVDAKAMRSTLITEQDLIAAIHNQGLERFEDVRLAIAEPNGTISVIPEPNAGKSGSGGQAKAEGAP
jgi:uncharacterized membrane protein YcaP (DUF421 family)